jgi:hypothetical protein
MQMHLMVAIPRNPVMVTNSFYRLRAVPQTSIEEGGLGERGKIEPNPQSYVRHAPRASGI